MSDRVWKSKPNKPVALQLTSRSVMLVLASGILLFSLYNALTSLSEWLFVLSEGNAQAGGLSDDFTVVSFSFALSLVFVLLAVWFLVTTMMALVVAGNILICQWGPFAKQFELTDVRKNGETIEFHLAQPSGMGDRLWLPTAIKRNSAMMWVDASMIQKL